MFLDNISFSFLNSLSLIYPTFLFTANPFGGIPIKESGEKIFMTLFGTRNRKQELDGMKHLIWAGLTVDMPSPVLEVDIAIITKIEDSGSIDQL